MRKHWGFLHRFGLGLQPYKVSKSPLPKGDLGGCNTMPEFRLQPFMVHDGSTIFCHPEPTQSFCLSDERSEEEST